MFISLKGEYYEKICVHNRDKLIKLFNWRNGIV